MSQDIVDTCLTISLATLGLGPLLVPSSGAVRCTFLAPYAGPGWSDSPRPPHNGVGRVCARPGLTSVRQGEYCPTRGGRVAHEGGGGPIAWNVDRLDWSGSPEAIGSARLD